MKETLKTFYARWLEPWSSGSSPIEIRRGILDQVEAKAVAVGGGKKIFPYDRLRIHLLAADPEQRSVLEGVLADGWDLEASIQQVLDKIGCQIPSGLKLKYVLDEAEDHRFGDRSFFIEYLQSAAPPTDNERPILEIKVVSGKTSEEVYTTQAARIHIGRLPEVLDNHGRLERRNEIAFSEKGEINASVSRKHASIRYDDETRAYWIRDNNSAGGTRIFRDGRPISVGRHLKGVRIQDGDEISLGRAQIAIRLRRGE